MNRLRPDAGVRARLLKASECVQPSTEIRYGMLNLQRGNHVLPPVEGLLDRAAVDDTGQSVDPADLSGDAVRERVGAGQKRVVPGFKLDQPDVLFDPLTLHRSRSR